MLRLAGLAFPYEAIVLARQRVPVRTRSSSNDKILDPRNFITEIANLICVFYC